jgi:Domain of unknown function (DUF4381)
MNPAELDLRDIHAAANPSWWPPAPGWWVVAILLLLLLGYALYRLIPWWRRVRQRKSIVAAFEREIAHPDLTVAQLSELLRRTARLRDPAAATLLGEPWLVFLDDALKTREFLGEAGRELLTAPFQRAPTAPSAALIALCRRWLQAVLR